MDSWALGSLGYLAGLMATTTREMQALYEDPFVFDWERYEAAPLVARLPAEPGWRVLYLGEPRSEMPAGSKEAYLQPVLEWGLLSYLVQTPLPDIQTRVAEIRWERRYQKKLANPEGTSEAEKMMEEQALVPPEELRTTASEGLVGEPEGLEPETKVATKSAWKSGWTDTRPGAPHESSWEESSRISGHPMLYPITETGRVPLRYLVGCIPPTDTRTQQELFAYCKSLFEALHEAEEQPMSAWDRIRAEDAETE